MGKHTAERRLASENAAVDLWRRAAKELGFPQDVPCGVLSDKLREIDRDDDAQVLEWYRDILDTQHAPSRWLYNGDVNLEHGGTFIDLSSWQWGWADAIRVIDLDSACGFTGACLIERAMIHRLDSAADIKRALASCGSSARTFNVGLKDGAKAKQCIRHMIADAMLSYGFADIETIEVVQMENNGPMKFDGWEATKRLRNCDLMGYVKAIHLKD